MQGTEARRPRVVILGGGFAGIGAAQKLKKADVGRRARRQARLPHLPAAAVPARDGPARDQRRRTLAARPRPRTRTTPTVHKATVTAIDLDAREVQFAEMAPLTYDYLVLGLGAEVNFFGTEGAAEHAFPMYTLPDAVRLKEHVLGRWEAADKDPALIDDGALNVVVVGGGPTGVETAGALAELYRGDLRQGLSGPCRRSRPASSSSRPGPSSSRCSSRTSATTRRRR